MSTAEQAREKSLQERDENTCRKALNPSEAVEMARRIEALEKPKAKERHREGGKKAGRGRPSQEKVVGTSPKLSDRVPRAADTAAAAVGMDRRTCVQHDPAGLHLHKATAIHPLPIRQERQVSSSKIFPFGAPQLSGLRGEM